MKLSDKLLQHKHVETPYQRVAKEFGVTSRYVGMVARGQRKPIRGKGLQVRQRLEELINQSEKLSNLNTN